MSIFLEKTGMVLPSKSMFSQDFKKNLFVLGLYEFLVNLESKILWFILVKSHCGLGKANKDTRLFKLTLRSLIAKPSEDRHKQDFLSSRINAIASLEMRF